MPLPFGKSGLKIKNYVEASALQSHTSYVMHDALESKYVLDFTFYLVEHYLANLLMRASSLST